jgi:splicing factor 45
MWDPSEAYDPSRPNDYNEYKIWKHREHEERIERLAKERRMEAQKRLRRSSSRSDYTESEPEDIRPRKTGTTFWEALSSTRLTVLFYEGRFGSHDDRWSREDDEYPQGGIGSTPVTRPPPPDVHMSGEEAYQRRLVMSSGFKPTSQTTSSASASVAVDAAGSAAIGSPTPLARAETGEEAYLRRVAMSQAPQPSASQPASSQLPSSTGDEAYQRRAALSNQQSPLPPPQHQQELSEPSSDSSGYNPFAAQPAPAPPPPIPNVASAGDVTPDFEERVRHSRSAAAAIAARFSALAPAESKDLSDSAPDESVPGPSTR